MPTADGEIAVAGRYNGRLWRRAPGLAYRGACNLARCGEPGEQVLTVILAGPRQQLPQGTIGFPRGAPGRWCPGQRGYGHREA